VSDAVSYLVGPREEDEVRRCDPGREEVTRVKSKRSGRRVERPEILGCGNVREEFDIAAAQGLSGRRVTVRSFWAARSGRRRDLAAIRFTT
jgi:hypothetical protein